LYNVILYLKFLDSKKELPSGIQPEDVQKELEWNLLEYRYQRTKWLKKIRDAKAHAKEQTARNAKKTEETEHEAIADELAPFPSDVDWLKANCKTGKEIDYDDGRHDNKEPDVSFYVWWKFGPMGEKMSVFMPQPAVTPGGGGRAAVRATAKELAKLGRASQGGGTQPALRNEKEVAKERSDYMKAKSIAIKEYNARSAARTTTIAEAAQLLAYMQTHCADESEQIKAAQEKYFKAMLIDRPDLDEIIATVLQPDSVVDTGGSA
jgi:hypothetical protein